jgi:hypothetical protein
MRYAVVAVVLLSFCGCTRKVPEAGPSGAGTETVLITYHVAAGMEDQLTALLAEVWDVYRKENLVFAQPHVVVRDKEAGDKVRFVEIFTWVNSEAPDHPSDTVKSLWDEMQKCCEKRDGRPGLEGGEVQLVVPAVQ